MKGLRKKEFNSQFIFFEFYPFIIFALISNRVAKYSVTIASEKAREGL